MKSSSLLDKGSCVVDGNSASQHPLLHKLLANRGITTKDETEKFLNPDYDSHLHDPFLMRDMDKAVDRILKAIKQGERILIFTDYDTDGTPAAVIFYDFFTEIGYKNFENYIPNRNNEGYGLNVDAIKRFHSEDVRLLITADCGISDVKEIECAKELGIDVIVTDHHLIPQPVGGSSSDGLPPAFAVINPKRGDDSYPFPMLCGAGVAFKLVYALLIKGRKQGVISIPEGWEKWLLDMVGIATISDMVPLTDENRTLAYFGLKVLRKSRRHGLRQLLYRLNVKLEHLTEDDVGFVIGPRINAAGRMDDPLKAFYLLSTKDVVMAAELARELDDLNSKRKGVVASIIKEAKRKIASNELRDVVVLGNLNWHIGVLGLAANNLMNEFQRPVFLWARGDTDILKGSCRSNGDVSVVELMTAASGLLLEFGGHENAGGFSIGREKVHLLEEMLVGAYQKIEKNKVDTTGYFIDAALSLDDINWDTYKVIEQLAPFGEGNPKLLI